jgi:hypothetical protein
MTRPFGIWCQRGRNLEEWCVIFRGSSPLCILHTFGTLALHLHV